MVRVKVLADLVEVAPGYEAIVEVEVFAFRHVVVKYMTSHQVYTCTVYSEKPRKNLET